MARKTIVGKIILWLWILFIAGVATLFFIFISLSKGWVGNIPSVDDLEDPIDKFATQVISFDGVVLGTFAHSEDNRVWVGFDELSPNLVKALIATEDIRFLDHCGIDLKAIVRVVIKRMILQQKSAGGGSTITQQLAKQLYTEHVARNSLQRALQKPSEWVIAVKLERYYTKEEILTLYLNKYDFGNNAIGINTASRTYFGKLPIELNPEEAAMLIGMCQNSSLYNPLRREELTRERRNVVLSQMEKAGFLTSELKDSLQNMELGLNYHKVDHKVGSATYFREYLRRILRASKPDRANYRGWQMQQFYEDSLDWEQDPLFGWCNKNTKPDGEPYNLYTDGLKIYVTIDSRMQAYAEAAVDSQLRTYLQPNFFRAKRGSRTAPFTTNLTDEEVESIMVRTMQQTDQYRALRAQGLDEQKIREIFDTPRKMSVFSYSGDIDTVMSPMDSLKYLKFFLRSGFMCMENQSGYVKAYVGGSDYRMFMYDMVTTGRRQVGSTIKPFLYSLAMESGYSPCDQIINQTQTILTEAGQIWRPRDDGKQMLGELVTIKWGLSRSNNNITAYLMSKLSPYAFVDLLHEYGLRNQSIEPVQSLCLGTCDVSVQEMVSGYSAFPNRGIRTVPLYVTRIEDSEGNLLAQFSARSNEVISEETSYKMIDMMRAVVNEGTAIRLRNGGTYPIISKMDCGAKTGTTDNHSDAWFVGYTPDLVAGCWVGGEDRDIHFDTMEHGQGAHAALPLWGIFMEQVYADSLNLGYSPSARFEMPENYDPCAEYPSAAEEPDSYIIERF
ncbi:MAG TPA: transglycosylase domain-containing protein [Bacteroidaceae bacterium]|nr:transglycosylase domain-containing protein [Bacteroidaceae bacterium]MBP8603151.1 transglycosylase domain-containing protein [Bacteroidaceae bacterium]HOD68215.1 transglycosylase domain-containing protein [Bacteroidaceae bacterium]HQL26101.1 transglycosylase domain-containing protein [Bacteroidaceae bacterium]